MSKKTVLIITIILFSASLFSGCWDKVEIDQRAFVGVIMVDMAPPGYEEKVEESVKNIPGIEKQTGKMIKVTYEFPNASEIAGNDTGSGGGGGGEEEKGGISSVAVTIDETNRYIDSRLSRRLFFGFTQTIIFGEELLKNPDKFEEVLDYFRRAPEFGRSMRVLAAEGEACKVAEIKPKNEKLLFRYIRGILENESSNGRISDITFNEFITMLSANGDSVMPKVTVKGDELKIAGDAIIKDYKLQGFLPEYDSFYFNALSGKRKAGSESINTNGLTVNYLIRNTGRSIKLINDDPENIEVGINIETEGVISSASAGMEIYDDNFIKKVERDLNDVDEESCSFVIKKLQKDYKNDALLIGEYLRKHNPSLWNKVKDKWNEVYPTIKIIPTVDNKIRRIGTVK
ncbi:MAG: Ger(x)C family spore germination protein [Clostridiales bacterium]|nr:Ger(x)C family spore germination protein [Clostridiales bacterium]